MRSPSLGRAALCSACLLLASLAWACADGDARASEDADAGPVQDECSALTLPLPSRLVPGVPAAEDFDFDREGYLVTLLNGNTLVRMERAKPLELLAPNVVVHGRGLRVLASGETLIADQDRSLVVAVDGEGAVRNVTTDVANPNGLLRGPDQTVYISDFGITGKVFRLDLSSGKTTVVAAPGKGSNGLALSPDGHWLYIGDHDLGLIHRVSVHLDGTYGAPEQLAQGLVRPDGLAADRCGTLYAASWDGKLYTVSPDGKVAIAAEFEGPVSAVSFGSGAHGFADDKLYVMAISKGGVYELDVGRHAPPPP